MFFKILFIAVLNICLACCHNYARCGVHYKCVPSSLCINRGQGEIEQKQSNVAYKANEKCCHEMDILTANTTVLPSNAVVNFRGCGYSDDSFTPKISNNIETADEGEFPWIVALLRCRMASPEHNAVLLDYIGVGSLLAPNAVLTAYHKVQNENMAQLQIRAGQLKLNATQISDSDIKVARILRHEQYNGQYLYNDIAILILQSSFSWSSNISPICLPPANAKLASQRCMVAGWGKASFNSSIAVAAALKKTILPIVERNSCEQTFQNDNAAGRFFELHSSYLCAGGEEGQDTCTGDGGAPLTCRIAGRGNRYFQVGITVKGHGCGHRQLPGLYADVLLFSDWIRNKLTENGIDLSYATI